MLPISGLNFALPIYMKASNFPMMNVSGDGRIMNAAFCRKTAESVRWSPFKILLIFVILIFCSPCRLGAGEFYRWVDENGVVHVSDNFPESSPSSGTTGKQEVQRVRVPVNAPARSPFRVPAIAREPEPYSSPDEYRIPFTATPTGGILVKGVFDDTVDVTLLYDTGANFVLISEALAQKLNYSSHVSRSIKMSTAGGIVDARTAVIGKVAVGDACKENVLALIAGKDAPTDKFDGLLGMSFLKDFQATVDYKNRIIILKRH
jgi:clan AA aspartic protease (TIGR02281 family)